MSNLFTRQIMDRVQADESMRKTADSLIDDAVVREPTGDALGDIRSNEAALKRILSLCGIPEDRLGQLDQEDVLFTRVETDPVWFRHQTGYCIGVDEKGSFTALLPGRLGGYCFYDESGKKREADKNNAGRFSKVYCLCRLLPEETLTIPALLRYLMSFMRRKTMGFYVFLSLAAGVLGLAFPGLVSMLMNAVEATPDVRASWTRLLAIATLCVLAELLRLSINLFLAGFESSFTTTVSCNVKNAALIRYLSDIENTGVRRSTAEIWSAISNGIPEFIDNLLCSGLSLIPHLIFTLCYCLAAAVILRSISLWMFSVLVLLSLAMWFVNMGFDRWYTRTLKARIKGDRIIFHLFRGIEKIRSREAQKRVYLNWAKTYSEEVSCDKQRKKYNAIGTSIQDFVTPLLSVVLILVLISSPISGSLPYSSFLTGILLAGLLAGEISELTQIVQLIVNTKSRWQTISFLFDGGAKAEKKVKCTDFTAEVCISRLSFAYPGMERLLDDVSFEVKEGEYVGIVGMSGCGKSTLLKLLLGILKPDKGEISYGRYELSNTDQRTLLRNMGIILQNESLIPGTIRQNLMMQPRPVTEEDIWKTLEQIGIADLVRSFPSGLDTEIGVSGASISGGQMQKLLIARAIVSGPKMIVFDEATSALDNVSQKEIKTALDSMNCTRIVVAHRLSTVKDCDRIILLDNGRIAQQGTYDELVGEEGLFRELVLCQSA